MEKAIRRDVIIVRCDHEIDYKTAKAAKIDTLTLELARPCRVQFSAKSEAHELRAARAVRRSGSIALYAESATWSGNGQQAGVFLGSTFVCLELVVASSVKIDDDLKERIQHLAGLRQRSTHWVMREAIRQYVEREEARESIKQETLASWQAYRETGRHITGAEARAWLVTWGAGDEKVAPECHG